MRRIILFPFWFPVWMILISVMMIIAAAVVACIAILAAGGLGAVLFVVIFKFTSSAMKKLDNILTDKEIPHEKSET